jgi:mRNA interferase MazF
MKPRAPVSRGEIWLADLNPTRGHEQAGMRPVLVMSDDIFNRGAAGLVIALPLTTTLRPIPSHIRVDPPEGGLRHPSAVLCEAVRAISTERLHERWGRVRPGTIVRVEDVLRILLRL